MNSENCLPTILRRWFAVCWYNDANVFFNKVTWSVQVYQRLGINTLQLFEVRLGKIYRNKVQHKEQLNDVNINSSICCGFPVTQQYQCEWACAEQSQPMVELYLGNHWKKNWDLLFQGKEHVQWMDRLCTQANVVCIYYSCMLGRLGILRSSHYIIYYVSACFCPLCCSDQRLNASFILI